MIKKIKAASLGITLCTILIYSMILLSAGCDKSVNAVKNENEINIWYYENSDGFGEIVRTAISAIEEYGKDKDIKINVTCWKHDELSYDDYELKHSIAMNAEQIDISFGEIRDFYLIRKMSGDYSKLSTYDAIWDNYKGYYSVPLLLMIYYSTADGRLFERYGVQAPDIIYEGDYYKLKQAAKEKGAVFKLNSREMWELVEYYIRKYNGFMYKDGKSSLDKERTEDTIRGIYDDLKKYYGNIDITMFEDDSRDITDTLSNITLREYGGFNIQNIQTFRTASNISRLIDNNPQPDHTVYCIEDRHEMSNIGIFISKNASQEVYDAASVLYSDEFYLKEYSQFGSVPVIDTEKIRVSMQVDENWKYNGYVAPGKELAVEVFNKAYNNLRNLNFDYYFANSNLKYEYKIFIIDNVIELIKNPDYADELDNKINSFLMNVVMRED